MPFCKAATIPWNNLLGPYAAPVLLVVPGILLLTLLLIYRNRVRIFNAQLLALEKKQQQLLLDASLR